MASDRTEKHTPRRLQKARDDGRFPVSREALAAITFTLSIWLILSFLPSWLNSLEAVTVFLVRRAFHEELSLRGAMRLWQLLMVNTIPMLLIGGAAVVALGIAVQMGMTGFGVANKKIAPDFKRLNPLSKLKQMPMQNLQSAAQSVVLLAVFGAIIAVKLPGWYETALSLPRQSLGSALATAGGEVTSLLKQSVLVLLLFGSVDFVRTRFRYFKELKMTKQEIREEVKESDGNPQIKQKIRRLQRDAARRRMMEQVPKATAIIVNPTHYSVAIFYDMEAMGAPRVVAKGKNYIARRIREIAKEHEIPIIENPPLARSLYKHVEVGHEIPANFYRAVAEVLAYIYRLTNGRLASR